MAGERNVIRLLTSKKLVGDDRLVVMALIEEFIATSIKRAANDHYEIGCHIQLKPHAPWLPFTSLLSCASSSHLFTCASNSRLLSCVCNSRLICSSSSATLCLPPISKTRGHAACSCDFTFSWSGGNSPIISVTSLFRLFRR